MTPYEDIVDRIYQAAAAPNLWVSVLQDISNSVGASLGALLVARSDQWVGWRLSGDTPAVAETYLRSDTYIKSQSTARLIQMNRAGFVGTHEIFTDEEYLADPLMTELGALTGLHHAAATAIHIPTGDTVVVHVQRKLGLPKLDAAALGVLDGFRPHLARAGLLAARWRLERLKAAAEALALVGLPAVVVDLRGRVLAANPLIEAMSSWIAWLPGDRIGLCDSGANELLRGALVGLGKPADPAVRSVPVKATESTDAAVVHVIPATGRARDFFGGAFAIVVITVVAPSPAPTALILHALFDLTPAEARIAGALARGLTLEQIALQYAVTLETVRSQTKAIFAKTGTHRQAQVAALLAGMPKMPIVWS